LAPKENRFFSGIFSSEFLNAKNEEIRQKFLSLYKAWNVRWINSRLDKVSKQKAKDADLKVVSWITHMSGFQGLSSEDVTGRKDIDLRTVLNDGSRSRHKCQLCPQYAIDHGKKGDDFFEAFKKVIKKQIDENASAVGYDYEPWSPDRGMLRSCFCPRCMKAFAAFSGLPESECVPEKILKYKDKWIKFRCWQNAAVYKVFCGIVRDINPDVKIFFASSKVFLPETRDRFLQWEGVDLTNCKEYDELTDLHTPMIYSNGATFYKDVEIASNTLSKPLFPVICPGDGVVAFMSADMIVMNIMAALAHDCKGIYIYPGAWELDGQCLSKITEAFGIIKDVEKFVYDGKKDKNLSIKPYPGKLVKAVSSDGKEIEIQVPDWSKLFFSKAFTLDGELLAFLFNYHQSLDCFVKIKTESLESGKQWQIFDLFRNAWVGKRFYSTEELKTGIVFKCAPERVSLLKISSYNKDDETNCILPASKAPEVKVEKLSGSLADKDSKISWASQGGDLCLRLSLPSQTVVINPDHGARIWSWTPKGACELVAANTGERGSGLARDMFWQPRSGRWSKDQDSRYLFEKSSLTDEYASAIFSRKLVSNNFSGIEIVKEFRAFKKRPEIEVIVTVANQSERDFSFIFWMHNHPVIREQLIATQALDPKNALYLEIPMEGGKKHLTGPLAKGESIFFEGNSNNKDGLYRETAGNLNEGYLLEYCNLTGEALKFSFDNNKLLQAYHWRGTVPTIEFMFGKTTLAPGKEWSEKVKMEYIKKYDLKDLKILK
jgi:hypothetical protein